MWMIRMMRIMRMRMWARLNKLELRDDQYYKMFSNKESGKKLTKERSVCSSKSKKR